MLKVPLHVRPACPATERELGNQLTLSRQFLDAIDRGTSTTTELLVPPGPRCSALLDFVIDSARAAGPTEGGNILGLFLTQARAISWDEFAAAADYLIDSTSTGTLDTRTLIYGLGVHRRPAWSGPYLDDGYESFAMLSSREPQTAFKLSRLMPQWFASASDKGDVVDGWHVMGRLAPAYECAGLETQLASCMDAQLRNSHLSLSEHGGCIQSALVLMNRQVLRIKGYTRAQPYFEMLKQLHADLIAGTPNAAFKFSLATTDSLMDMVHVPLRGTWATDQKVRWPICSTSGMEQNRRYNECCEILSLSARERFNFFSPKSSMLEIGYGNGNFLWDVCCAHPISEAVGTEQDYFAYRRAQQRPENPSQRRELISGSVPRYHQSEGHELPFADDSFDFTCSVFGVPYYSNSATELRETLQESIRVTKPGGTARFGPWVRHTYPIPVFSGLSRGTCEMLDTLGVEWKFLLSTVVWVADRSGNRGISHDQVLDLRKGDSEQRVK